MNYQVYFVYIITNKNRTVIYTGVTNNLKRRLIEHKEQRGNPKSFSGRYHTCYLLYFTSYKYIRDAIAREKEIKGWRREKKMYLIKSFNPELRFLNDEI